MRNTRLAGVADDTFTDVLPLLRRTFATFGPPERRQIGEHVRRLGDGTAGRDRAAADDDVDPARGELVLPMVARLLGVAR